MAALNGKYTLVASDNFDGYLREIGVSEELIEMSKDANAETGITQDGDNYAITMKMCGKDMEIKFKLDEEFEETMIHGAIVKTIFKREGDRLIQTQKGSFESVTTRDYNGDELTVTLKSGGVVCIRNYEKVE